MDFSTLTDAIDFATVNTALMAVGAAFVGVLIVRRGIKFILSMF